MQEGTGLSKKKRELYSPKEVFPDLFQLRIPLPIPALEHLNTYLIRGENEDLIIDAGMDGDRAFFELQRQIREVGVNPEKITRVLVTHFHIDHVGLVPRLRRLSGAKLTVSAKTLKAVQLVGQSYKNHWKKLMDVYEVAGVPTKLLEDMLKATPERLYKAVYEELARPSKTLRDGEKISIGKYDFRTIWTPGHSPGHICLYERKRRLIIAGDHLLPTITPHVTQWSEESNALADYLESLDKVGKLDADVILPGHEEPFNNHRKRISELKEHHRVREKEILSEIQTQELTTYQIASRIGWDVEYASWDQFPLFQKLLAVSETSAHLKLLEEQGQVEKSKLEETLLYHAI